MKNIVLGLLISFALVSLLIAKDYEVLKKEIPLGKEKSLEVNMEMGLANLEVVTGDSRSILIARVEYNPEKIKPIIEYHEGITGILDIESRKKHRVKLNHMSKGENDWHLAFTDRIPIDINLELGLGEGNMDLTGMQISGLSVDAGLSELDIRFDKPNKEEIRRFTIDSGLGQFTANGLLNANIRDFRFSGGLGDSKLYFTGMPAAHTNAKVEVGLGSLEIIIERGIPVKLYYEKSFLSSLDLDDFRKIDDDVYVSKNWDEDAERKLILDVEIGLGSVSIEWE